VTSACALLTLGSLAGRVPSSSCGAAVTFHRLAVGVGGSRACFHVRPVEGRGSGLEPRWSLARGLDYQPADPLVTRSVAPCPCGRCRGASACALSSAPLWGGAGSKPQGVMASASRSPRDVDMADAAEWTGAPGGGLVVGAAPVGGAPEGGGDVARGGPSALPLPAGGGANHGGGDAQGEGGQGGGAHRGGGGHDGDAHGGGEQGGDAQRGGGDQGGSAHGGGGQGGNAHRGGGDQGGSVHGGGGQGGDAHRGGGDQGGSAHGGGGQGGDARGVHDVVGWTEDRMPLMTGGPAPVCRTYVSPPAMGSRRGILQTADDVLLGTAQANRRLALVRIEQGRWSDLPGFIDIMVSEPNTHVDERLAEVHGDANFGNQGEPRQAYEVLAFANEIIRFGVPLHMLRTPLFLKLTFRLSRRNGPGP